MQENIIFSPKENINKKEYTPDVIYADWYISGEVREPESSEGEDTLTRKYSSKYTLRELLSFLMRYETLESVILLLNDYPDVVNMKSNIDELPIYQSLGMNNLKLFQLLKQRGSDFNNLDFDYMNVYECALIKPEFWSSAYGELTDDELYKKLVETKADIYQEGCFEFLFRGDDYATSVVREFKAKYPIVFKKIILEKADNPVIKKATGETLRIIHNYDGLEKELNEHYDGQVIAHKKPFKF